MDKIILHGFSVSPHVRTARIAFHEKQVPIELVEMSLDDVNTDAFGRINPFRKMPALVHGHITLFETPALLAYADSLGATPILNAGNGLPQARMWQFIGIAQNYLFPTGVLQLWFQNVATGLFGLERDAAISEAAAERTMGHLMFLEQALADGWLACGRFSFADIYCGAMVDYIAHTRDGRAMIAGLPNVAAWLSALRQRPSFIETLAPMLAGRDQL